MTGTDEITKIAYDKVNECFVVIVRERNKTADEVIVKEGMTVAEWPGNGSFPEDDDVVTAVILEKLNLANLGKFEDLTLYDFPVSRLDMVDLAELTDFAVRGNYGGETIAEGETEFDDENERLGLATEAYIEKQVVECLDAPSNTFTIEVSEDVVDLQIKTVGLTYSGMDKDEAQKELNEQLDRQIEIEIQEPPYGEV